MPITFKYEIEKYCDNMTASIRNISQSNAHVNSLLQWYVKYIKTKHYNCEFNKGILFGNTVRFPRNIRRSLSQSKITYT